MEEIERVRQRERRSGYSVSVSHAGYVTLNETAVFDSEMKLLATLPLSNPFLGVKNNCLPACTNVHPTI